MNRRTDPHGFFFYYIIMYYFYSSVEMLVLCFLGKSLQLLLLRWTSKKVGKLFFLPHIINKHQKEFFLFIFVLSFTLNLVPRFFGM